MKWMKGALAARSGWSTTVLVLLLLILLVHIIPEPVKVFSSRCTSVLGSIWRPCLASVVPPGEPIQGELNPIGAIVSPSLRIMNRTFLGVFE